MRNELRYVFDRELSGDDMAAKGDAIKHLRAMENPKAWVADQMAFDVDLANVNKISTEEMNRRYNRWRNLLNLLEG